MKFLKLLIVAVVVIGGITGLVLITGGKVTTTDGPEVHSKCGEDIQKAIEALCEDGAWSKSGYEDIEENKIQLNKSRGNLQIDEAKSLQEYLYSLSCSYVRNGADNLFKQSSYSAGKVSHYDAAISYLKTKGKKNSNLEEADNMYSSYHSIMGMLNVKKGVSYSHPLKAYSGGNAGSIKSRVMGMPYFKSHFSNNSDIMSRLNRLSESVNGEDQYYSELEKCVEQHYRSTHSLETLLADQIRFNSISTNKSAIDRLNNFINNGL